MIYPHYPKTLTSYDALFNRVAKDQTLVYLQSNLLI